MGALMASNFSRFHDFFGQSGHGGMQERQLYAQSELLSRLLNGGGVSDAEAATGLFRGARVAHKFYDQGLEASGEAAATGFLERALKMTRDNEARRELALGTMRGGLATSDRDFAEREKYLTEMQFSSRTDQGAMASKQAMAALRRNLGARGVGFNSGVGQGLAAQIELQRTGQAVGARRDVAIDAARRRFQQQQFRTGILAQIAGLENQQADTTAMDALQDVASLQFQRAKDHRGERMTRKAASRAATAGAIQGGFGLLGSLL